MTYEPRKEAGDEARGLSPRGRRPDSDIDGVIAIITIGSGSISNEER